MVKLFCIGNVQSRVFLLSPMFHFWVQASYRAEGCRWEEAEEAVDGSRESEAGMFAEPAAWGVECRA